MSDQEKDKEKVTSIVSLRNSLPSRTRSLKTPNFSLASISSASIPPNCTATSSS